MRKGEQRKISEAQRSKLASEMRKDASSIRVSKKLTENPQSDDPESWNNDVAELKPTDHTVTIKDEVGTVTIVGKKYQSGSTTWFEFGVQRRRGRGKPPVKGFPSQNDAQQAGQLVPRPRDREPRPWLLGQLVPGSPWPVSPQNAADAEAGRDDDAAATAANGSESGPGVEDEDKEAGMDDQAFGHYNDTGSYAHALWLPGCDTGNPTAPDLSCLSPASLVPGPNFTNDSPASGGDAHAQGNKKRKLPPLPWAAPGMQLSKSMRVKRLAPPFS